MRGDCLEGAVSACFGGIARVLMDQYPALGLSLLAVGLVVMFLLLTRSESPLRRTRRDRQADRPEDR